MIMINSKFEFSVLVSKMFLVKLKLNVFVKLIQVIKDNLNPLSSRLDQHLSSPYNIHTSSSKQVRILKLIG